MRRFVSLTLLAILVPLTAPPATAQKAGDFVITNFHFTDRETLPKLTLHYLTLGAPRHDAKGLVTNAVLILHGTTGTGSQFLSPVFAGVLYGP
ncbi:MAG TPA: hypothetical protein VIC55_00020, partial [Gemmatimonadaceae bacterium]